MHMRTCYIHHGPPWKVSLCVTGFGCAQLCIICVALLNLISFCFLHSPHLAIATSIVTMYAFLCKF